MATHNIVEIDISALLLDLENPRHDILDNQTEAMRQMVDDQEDKLLNLAKDIVEVGVNPSELPIVTPFERDPNLYVVLEGNRRVAAIKLLLNPLLATEGRKPSLKGQFLELSREFERTRIDRLQCVVVEQREDLDHWIQLRHTGENKGVGVVGWDPEAVTRFNARLGRSDFNTLARQVMQYLRQIASEDDKIKLQLDRVRLTNLARLVNDPDVRKMLGLRAKNGEIETDLPQDELSKGLTKIVDDLSSGRITVKDIYYKADRQEYLETFGPRDKPNSEKATGVAWKLTSGPTSTTSPDTKVVSQSRRSVPLSTKRKTIIPPNVRLRIHHHRLNQIYHELKKLEVDRFPNCAAVMLRVFLELSVDEYASVRTIPGFTSASKLYQKLQSVADLMEKNGTLTRNQLKEVRVASTTQNTLFSTNTLNAFVHNKDFAPKPSELKMTWDNMQLFIEKLWE